MGYKSSRMRKLVEKLRPASGAASIVSNPFPPPRRSLSPRGPPSPPPPSPSLPRQDVAVLEDGSRGLFRQLANPANMCQHVRVRVRVHVCVPRDLATLSSLLRYPPSLPRRIFTFLPDVFTAAKIKVCAATRGSRGRIGR